MKHEDGTALPADEGRLDRCVGRPVPKRCEPCRATGALHCADPENCGGPWDKRHDQPKGCHECAWGKVAGCWRCGSR